MLHHIKPNRKKSKEGGLTLVELPLVKGLLKMGYSAQDIVHIINQGRASTINLARVTEAKRKSNIKAASDEEVKRFLRIQSAYDPKTLLNPFKDHRLIRAREAMIAAVQVFNSPTVLFKTEMFCVFANIAWTYLLHEKMERTKEGSVKLDNGNSITVAGTLDRDVCPNMDEAVKENLRKIIEIRDAVEHTFFVGADECFGALFQANCVNFDKYMTKWFGDELSLAKELSLALQFVGLNKMQIFNIEASDFPPRIRTISSSIDENPYAQDNAFQLNVYYTTELSSKTNSDIHKLISHEEGKVSAIIAVKKMNYTKLPQRDVVKKVQNKGFRNFSAYDHQLFWQSKWIDVKKRNIEATIYGELVLKNQWLWYEQTWLPVVIKHCQEAGDQFK